MTLPPTEYGWTMDSAGKFTPIMTNDPIAPPELLKLTACNCKKQCNTMQYSCKRMGVYCIDACGICHGSNCQNIGLNHEEK